MASNRFEIAPINDQKNRKNKSFQSSEIIPLINIQTSIPTSSSFTSINEINKTSTRLFDSLLHRSKAYLSTLSIPHSSSIKNSTAEETVSCHSTIHLNPIDNLTNKFLHELRLKRRELQEKAKNLSIDQRIALNYHRHGRAMIHAQDIFAINFELDDNDDKQSDLIDEDKQEQIRNNIFHELDRQRIKQYHKRHRHLVFARALLILVTSFLVFMSITLIYIVIHLIDQVKSYDTDTQFISMIYDTNSNN
jgi:hypothetical protein